MLALVFEIWWQYVAMLHVDCECRVLQTIPFRSVLILNKPISGNMLVVKVLVLCCWPAAWRSASRTNAGWVTCLQLCRPELRKRWDMIVHRKFRTGNGMDSSTITNQYRQYMQLADNVPNDLRQECLRVTENDLKAMARKTVCILLNFRGTRVSNWRLRC